VFVTINRAINALWVRASSASICMIYAPEVATLVKHPWANSMACGMNKKIKATPSSASITTPWTH
jgi:hypothetical protein